MGQCNATMPTLPESGSTRQTRKRSIEVGTGQIEVTITADGNADQDVPTFSEQAEQQWKVFNELDTQDEADMMTLASFFQTLAGSGIIKDTDMTISEDKEIVKLDNIKINNVGRLDSVIYNLNEFEIPTKGKITIETALDVIDCFRRGGKLSTQSVHKILKDVYWMLKKLPNIREANMAAANQHCTVIGDLHGQFADLLYILETTGMPSENNMYVFNGDFVDRGSCSLQIVLTLFSLMLAEPSYMFLNRGNHEDAGICCVFGFMKECLANYDEVTFSMFVEVFRYLPLATTINAQIFVLHGGLFSHAGVLLEEIMEANRKDYNLAEEKNARPATFARGQVDDMDMKAYLDQVVKDMLWSDPHPSLGRRPNPRGEGVHFGADVTEEFLRENNLSMVVRSHECVPFGFGQPYDGDRKELLCTIFSASNYSSSGNHGAFLRFSTSLSKGAKEVKPVGKDPLAGSTEIANPRKTKLYYTVHCYYMGDPQEQERRLQEATQASLANLIMKKKVSLQKAFEEYDQGNTGIIAIDAWCEILNRVTKLQVQWKLLLPLLMPNEGKDIDVVNYGLFLNNFQLQYSGSNGVTQDDDLGAGKAMFDALYVNRRQLEAMFAFFDKDKNGSISREEFRQGCDNLNKLLPPEEQLSGIDHILDLIDFDHSNSIELNEFFEAFRLLDLKDGKLDGQIDIQTEQYMRKKGLNNGSTTKSTQQFLKAGQQPELMKRVGSEDSLSKNSDEDYVTNNNNYSSNNSNLKTKNRRQGSRSNISTAAY